MSEDAARYFARFGAVAAVVSLGLWAQALTQDYFGAISWILRFAATLAGIVVVLPLRRPLRLFDLGVILFALDVGASLLAGVLLVSATSPPLVQALSVMSHLLIVGGIVLALRSHPAPLVVVVLAVATPLLMLSLFMVVAEPPLLPPASVAAARPFAVHGLVLSLLLTGVTAGRLEAVCEEQGGADTPNQRIEQNASR